MAQWYRLHRRPGRLLVAPLSSGQAACLHLLGQPVVLTDLDDLAALATRERRRLDVAAAPARVAATRSPRATAQAHAA